MTMKPKSEAITTARNSAHQIDLAGAEAKTFAAGSLSRDDLSFTVRDNGGLLENWVVCRNNDSLWDMGLDDGARRFSEITTLAKNDEYEAYNAIRFALLSRNWSGAWGEEFGFSEALARVAILGLRALRSGATVFDVDEAEALWELSHD